MAGDATDAGGFAEAVCFLEYFSDLADPRQRGKVVYPLDEVLLLSLLAVLAGAETFADIARFGDRKLAFLRRFRPFRDGTPAHDHLGDIFASLDAAQFQRCFVAWVGALLGSTAAVIAIDGKTSRRSAGKSAGQAALHTVSAFAARQKLVLGQVKVSEKSNEIIAIPQLLAMLAIEGAIVTIDAMGCQRDIAQAIIDQKADYVLALKGNQGTLREDVEVFVTEQTAKGFADTASSRAETIDGDHGRIETRTTTVIHEVRWLQERHGWPALRGIVIVESARELPATSAGLSHMSKEFEEEVLAPSCEVHLALDGPCIWMGAQDVERHASDDAEVGGGVVLATSRIVFVKHDVELAMQVVLDAPMRSDDVAEAFGGEFVRQRDIVGAARDGAAGVGAFALDAAEGDEAGQGGGVVGASNDAGGAPLLAAMRVVAALVAGEPAAGVGGGKGGHRAVEQRRVVGLELDGEASAALDQRGGHGGVAVQRVGGDGAALQIEAFQYVEGGGDLVGGIAAGRRGTGGEGEPGFGVPDADQQRRQVDATTLIATPQTLAVDRHDPLALAEAEPLAQCRGEAAQRVVQIGRVEQAEQPAEAVMARRTVRQVEELAKFLEIGGSEVGNPHRGLAAAQRRQQGSKQHRRQVVLRRVVARVAHLPENRNE
jgi:predicted transposase YbfD/YdcC